MSKKLLTEQDIKEVAAKGQKEVFIDNETLLTPSAKDAVVRFKLTVTTKKDTPAPANSSRASSPSYEKSNIQPTMVGGNLVVLGSDHGGYATKEMLKKYLAELGYRTLDIGTNSEESCDYPDFAYAVARIVAKGEAWRGIMIDATGVASSIVCNKIPGVRAAACFNEFVAQSSREHNDSNVLTIGAKAIGSESIKSIVKIWLETWFGGGRHKKRVDKIIDIEQKFSK